MLYGNKFLTEMFARKVEFVWYSVQTAEETRYGKEIWYSQLLLLRIYVTIRSTSRHFIEFYLIFDWRWRITDLIDWHNNKLKSDKKLIPSSWSCTVRLPTYKQYYILLRECKLFIAKVNNFCGTVWWIKLESVFFAQILQTWQSKAKYIN